jgi:hypothetical protein
VLAIATVYLTLQGTAVVAQGKRRWVDPHWERGNSYLRIGWNWVKTALARGWPLFETFCLIGNFDPASAYRFSQTASAKALYSGVSSTLL